MPFKSRSQQRKMFAMQDRNELKRGTAQRWANETRNIRKLPNRVGTKRSTRRASRRS